MFIEAIFCRFLLSFVKNVCLFVSTCYFDWLEDTRSEGWFGWSCGRSFCSGEVKNKVGCATMPCGICKNKKHVNTQACFEF